MERKEMVKKCEKHATTKLG